MTDCGYAGCDGHVVDGFCDTCGRAAADGSAATVSSISAIPVSQVARASGYSRVTGRVTGARRPQATDASARNPWSQPSIATGPASSRASASGTRTRGSRGSSSRRHALGGGLVQMPTMPSLDPLKLLMADARVPDGKSFCPNCRNRVNPDKRFCPNCGAEYNFRPSLQAGQVLGEQYEVKGPIAFGGLGWIYLAMDIKLNRWVVLKGLLNTKDEAAAAAAIAERQFLAAVKHGKIVGIYTFVTVDAESYIVMEYVGGRTLKAIRKERGPLPVAEAVAYILGILPAFQYLHDQNLVYCDFKPDNVMLEGDDVKLIDMGAVRRIGDISGDIYGTVGYKAPEADDDPVAVSDLYTIGRTLAVLLLDFDNIGRYERSLPSPDELLYAVPGTILASAGLADAALRATLPDGRRLPDWLAFDAARRTFSGRAPQGVTGIDTIVTDHDGGTQCPCRLTWPLADNESLYRFLQKATAPAPDERFQSADEMGAQLVGVLRETVARQGPVPVADSVEFLPERSPIEAPVWSPQSAWRRLPDLRIDREDPGASDVLSAAAETDASRRVTVLETAIRAHPQSAEARLRLAHVLTDLGHGADRVLPLLDAALGLDPFDWRPDWVCGRLYLATAHTADAIACFDKVYNEIPGEVAPKLALAIALEMESRTAEAAGLYDTASRVTPMLATACFGLARCRRALGDIAGAIEAFERVPDGSACRDDAQMAIVMTLGERAQTAPGWDDLARASATLLAVGRSDIARHEAEASLALAAAQRLERGQTSPPSPASLLGKALTAREMRRHAEAALRLCARLSGDADRRIGFVDRANAIRPRSLV